MPRRPHRLANAFAACAAIACAVAGTGAAQGIPSRPPPLPRGTCDGDTITAIDIRPHKPSPTGLTAAAWNMASQSTNMRREGSRPELVRAYLRLQMDKPCTERDRAESERVLRAQPFIASASVRIVQEGPGRVHAIVDVVDEMPLIGNLTLARGTVGSIEFGTLNWDGAGLELAGSVERGFAYRTGFSMRAKQYGLFGKPDNLGIVAERNPLGERYGTEYSSPFLTDLQRHAWHAAFSTSSDYLGVVRTVGDNLSLFVRHLAWDVGWVTRIGRTATHTVGLAGFAFLGDQVRTAPSAVIVSDTGFVAFPSPQLDGRYPAHSAVRAAAIGGLRSLRFLTVRGFDAVTAEQDVGVGVQLNLLAGPDVQVSSGVRGVFAAGDLYAGVGDAESFVEARVLAEGHADAATHSWDGVVASSRMAWYLKPSAEQTRIVSVELSAIHNLPYPGQLSFRGGDGGLHGFDGARISGGQRAIVRVEQRRVIQWVTTRADVAYALFADAGKLWAGDVPFGQTSAIRGAVGVGLLAAIPGGGRRIYRLDLAFPVSSERGAAKFELRFSGTDRSRLLWTEPADLTRARSGAVPTNLMKW